MRRVRTQLRPGEACEREGLEGEAGDSQTQLIIIHLVPDFLLQQSSRGCAVDKDLAGTGGGQGFQS
jgi:hypothetical protein